MGSFKAALVNEIEKLYKKKKVLVAAILSLVIIIFGQLIILGVRSGFGLRGVGSMEFPILVLSVVVNTVLPLFTALVTIDSFSGEFSQNTMKITLIRPVSRIKFFTAKFTAIMLFVLTNLFLVMIFSTIAGLLFNSNSFSLKGILGVVVAYIVTIMPMMVLSIIIVTFTNFIKSGTGVFFLSILVFVGFKALEVIFSKYSALFFTSTFDWYNLWLMDSPSLSKIFREFMLMCSYVIILFTTSFYLFDKKDF